jgi:hypothetical protein
MISKGKMPSYKDKLTPEQIDQLLTFIRELGAQNVSVK